MFSVCFNFLLLAIRDSLKDSLDYTLNNFDTFANTLFAFGRRDRRDPSYIQQIESQMLILFKGFCRLSLVWIAKQCGWTLVSSSSIINWWTRLSRKVKGLRILFGSDTKRHTEDSRVGWHQLAAIHHSIRSTKRFQRRDE